MEKLRSGSPGKKIKVMRSIKENCKRDPKRISSVIAHIVPLLREEDEDVRSTVAKLLLEFSKRGPRAFTRITPKLLKIMKRGFKEHDAREPFAWAPYGYVLFAVGNVSRKYPKVGLKCLPLMKAVLKYPLYHPERPQEGLHILYAAAVKAIGQVGCKAPDYVDDAVSLVYKAFIDSYRFQFWKKGVKNKNEDMKYLSIKTLANVGTVKPFLVVPSLTSAFLDKDRKVVASARKILWMLTENLEKLYPALTDSLDVEKKQQRVYVTEFIVDVGSKYPDFMIRHLANSLNDNRKFVREHCATALGELFPDNPGYIPSVMPTLIEHLRDDPDLDVRQTVSDALTVISTINHEIFKDHVSDITSAMGDKYHHVRWRMAQIIRNIGKHDRRSVHEAIPYLIAGLDDRHDHVQWKCEEALETLDVDKIEYKLAIRTIKVGRALLNKAKEFHDAEVPEAEEMLNEATALTQNYSFQEAIEKGQKAKEYIERKVPHVAEGKPQYPMHQQPGHIPGAGFDPRMQYPHGPMPNPAYYGGPMSPRDPRVSGAPFGSGQRTVEKRGDSAREEKTLPPPPPGPESGMDEGATARDSERTDRKGKEPDAGIGTDMTGEGAESLEGIEEWNVNWDEGGGNVGVPGSGSGAGNEVDFEITLEESGQRGIENGYTYLLKDGDPNNAFQLFSERLGSQHKGMFITRSHPRKINRRYQLQDNSHIWLTKMPGDENVRPDKLHEVRERAGRFLRETRGGILLVDGIEYMIGHNDYEEVLELIRHLKDLASMGDSVVLITLEPSILKKNEIKSLEREVDMIL